MPRLAEAVLALLVSGPLVQAQNIVFTMRTHPSCPVLISSVASSRDFGFQTVSLLDDSPKAIDSMILTVVLTVGLREEVVDGGRAFVKLQPGDRKNVEVFLGRLQALRQRAQNLHLAETRAIVYVDSVDFADGTRWDDHEPLVGPGGDQPLRK